MRRALVTGGRGFVGRWLARELTYRGYEVAAADRVECDVCDSEGVQRFVRGFQPDVVFHLAGQPSVARSFANPVESFQLNVLGTVALLDALRLHAPGARLVIASSAEVYGCLEQSTAGIDETATPNPASPYAASKLAQEIAGFQYARSFGLNVIVARCFSLLGPGQAPCFAIAGFARQLAAIASGREPAVVRVGNLDPVRDVVDVRDATRALVEIVDAGESGQVYNVCTGRGVSIRELLDRLVAASGVSVEIEVDVENMRAVDTPWLVGSNARIRASTGWLPGVPLDHTLAEILADGCDAA